MTEIFALKHAENQKVDQAPKRFLTKSGRNTIPVPDQKSIIVTDFASTVQRVADLIRLIDQPQRPAARDV